MSNSIFSSLLGMLDKPSIGGIASALGESEQSVSRGMESSIAAVLGGLAAKSEDPNSLRRILGFVPGTLWGVTGSQLASGVANPNSPLLAAGRRVLSGLFGNSENAVTSALSAQSGLRPDVTSTLLAMAGPMVMSFIGTRVRAEGMTMSGLGSLLQRESSTFRSALPVSLRDQFWPREATASPVVAQAVEREKRSSNWLPLLAFAALVAALFWIYNHRPRPVIVHSVTMVRPPIAPAATGTASRIATEATDLMKPKLPDKVHLRFDTGSARLRPESQATLDDIAGVLQTNPNARMTVTGHTDSVGDAEQNRLLSEKRANAVVAELVHKGISKDRIAAEGSGQQYPVADNSTAEGRAQNRRVSVDVTQQ
jgi:outer membrane protein OmpA-like peptidoglycan-associated protein